MHSKNGMRDCLAKCFLINFRKSTPMKQYFVEWGERAIGFFSFQLYPIKQPQISLLLCRTPTKKLVVVELPQHPVALFLSQSRKPQLSNAHGISSPSSCLTCEPHLIAPLVDLPSPWSFSLLSFPNLHPPTTQQQTKYSYFRIDMYKFIILKWKNENILILTANKHAHRISKILTRIINKFKKKKEQLVS